MFHSLRRPSKQDFARWPGALGAALLLAGLWSGAPLARDEDASVALAGALHDLVAAEYAFDTARDDYRQTRTQGELSEQELSDFENFLGSLRQSVYHACERVESLGGSLEGHQAYCGGAGASAALSVPDPGRTRQEQIAAIDAELRTSIAEFDELLLREQQKLEASATSTGGRAGGGGAAGGGGQGQQGGQGAQGQQGQQGRQGADGQQGSQGLEGQSGGLRSARAGSEGSASEPRGEADGAGDERDGRRGSIGPGGGAGADIPDDIPEPQDDDIVARQLREAAENEPDPELRERLWNEYRRYKRSQRGG